MSHDHIITDRKLLKKPDGFLKFSASIMAAANKNRKLLFILLLCLVAIAVFYGSYSSYKTHRQEQAAAAAYPLEEKLKTIKPESVNAQTIDDLVRQVEKLAKDHKGTTSSFHAALNVGNLAYDHGDYQKAKTLYQLALAQASSRFLKLLALYAVGYTEEALKNHQAAISTFQDALRLGEKNLKAEIYMAIARNYELGGNKAKALEQYTQTATEFPNTEYAQTSEQQKKLLQQ